MSLPALALVGGESLLSLYPIIVRKTPLPIDWQIFSRLFVYTLIPIFFGNIVALSSIPLISWITISIANFIHIYTSYKGFQILAPGLAMTLLYLYPIFNLILLYLFFHLDVSPIILLFMFAPIALIYSIYQDRKDSQPKEKLNGVAFMLLAALTESIIYIILKYTNTGSNPWNAIFFTYFGSLIIALSLFIGGFRIDKLPDTSLSSFLTNNRKPILLLLIANIFIGAIGHMLRFFSIPLLAPIIFSILSFTGIISSHIFGNWFVGESISIPTIIKLGLLIISLIIIRFVAKA